MSRALIPHIDDLGVTGGSVAAMDELSRIGAVTSGSVMVPAPCFEEVAALARRRPELDIGIHLTLTSESDYLKWGPLTDPGMISGLVNQDGHFWKTVQEVRDRAEPQAVENELQAQIETALAAGIDLTHLDHHMGAALNPEFAEITVGLGQEFGVPVMLPRRIGDYFDLLGKGPVDLALMESLRDRLEHSGGVLVDQFVMGLEVDGSTQAVYRKLIAEADPGVTFLALHCNAPGDIEQVHPKDCQRRIEEYELFGDYEFAAWARDQAKLVGFRDLAR